MSASLTTFCTVLRFRTKRLEPAVASALSSRAFGAHGRLRGGPPPWTARDQAAEPAWEGAEAGRAGRGRGAPRGIGASWRVSGDFNAERLLWEEKGPPTALRSAEGEPEKDIRASGGSRTAHLWRRTQPWPGPGGMAEWPWPGHFNCLSLSGLRSPGRSGSLVGTEQPLRSGVVGGAQASSGLAPHTAGAPQKELFLGC